MRVFNRLRILGAVLFVTAMVVPCFGEDGAEQRNDVPTVTDVRMDPAEPQTGAEPKVDFKLKEPAVRAEVKWFVNDVEVDGKFDPAGTHAELGQPVKEDDKVKVEITPFDGYGNEGEVASKSFTVRNAPPELELVDQKIEGQTYKAKVKATDPQGGEVTLDLQGPEGMKMDSNGNILWKLSSTTAGKFDVKVTAKNEKGAESVLTYTVGIRR